MNGFYRRGEKGGSGGDWIYESLGKQERVRKHKGWSDGVENLRLFVGSKA